MGNVILACVHDYHTHTYARPFLIKGLHMACTFLCVGGWGGSRVLCFCCWILAGTDKYSAVKRCPSPFSDHFPIIPRPAFSSPTSLIPIFHSLSGRAASEESFQLSPTSPETSGPRCFKSECALAHGRVGPVRKRGLWAFVYAGTFDGLRGGKGFSTDWGPSTSEELWCGAARPGN